MANAKKKISFTISAEEIRRKVRSPFANVVFTGTGAHRSKKDYNRQAEKLATKKAFLDYK